MLFVGQCALSCWCGEENKTRLHPVRGYHKDAIELHYTPSCPGTFRFQLSEALLSASRLFLLNPREKLSKTVVYPPDPLDREGSTSMECALTCRTLAELVALRVVGTKLHEQLETTECWDAHKAVIHGLSWIWRFSSAILEQPTLAGLKSFVWKTLLKTSYWSCIWQQRWQSWASITKRGCSPQMASWRWFPTLWG